MNVSSFSGLFGVTSLSLLAFAILLLFILIISFRSRAIVFCQYLKTMTGV
ncbi:MAG: hypothetical protein ACXVID_00145 [Thermoanaerobaculia bacterium]